MSDILNKLLLQGDYQTIEKITRDQTNDDALIARFVALCELGQDEAALQLIEAHFETVTNEVKIVFRYHVELIKHKGDKVRGYRAYHRYMTLPYASIETEEALHEFKLWLDEEVTVKTFDARTWRLQMQSNDLAIIEKGLLSLPIHLINQEIDVLRSLLTKPIGQALRCATLSRLIEAHINDEFEYLVNGLTISVNPSLLSPPLVSDDLNEVLTHLDSHAHSPSESQLARLLLEQYIVAIYPLEPLFEDAMHLTSALLTLVSRYLGQKANSDNDYVNALIEEIETAIQGLTGQ